MTGGFVQQIWELVFSFPTVVFTTMLVIALAYWALVMFGLFDFDFGADGMVDGAREGGAEGLGEGGVEGMVEGAAAGIEGGVEGAVPAPPTAPSGGPQSGSGAAAAPPAVVSASALAGNTPKGRPDFLKPAKTIEGTATEADKNGSAEKPKSGTPGWPFPPSPSLSKNARGKDAEPEAGE